MEREISCNSKAPKLLIYAHYYVPDVASTGQILKELAEGMANVFDITIICVVPSYTGKIDEYYKQKRFYYEKVNGINIVRIKVSEFNKKKKLSRVKNVLEYFFGALVATFKVGNIDYVYSISQPPVLGGLIGVWGKWIKHAKYIYNIQDFNPEQIKAVKYSKNTFILKTMMSLDKFSCVQATKIIVVGRDMITTLKNRFQNKEQKVLPKSVFINNWIDENEIYPLDKNHPGVMEFKKKYGLENKFIIMYSGNLGLYYDLENIIKVIAEFRDYSDVIFLFAGDGYMRERLQDYKIMNKLDNVIFVPYQEKKNLIYSLNAGDIHWCVNSKGIKGVSVPSKLYGILGVGKPVLGVLEKDSEARIIIESTQCGFVTEPENYSKIKELIQTFIDMRGDEELVKMSQRGHEYLMKNLTKDISIQKYIKAILE